MKIISYLLQWLSKIVLIESTIWKCINMQTWCKIYETREVWCSFWFFVGLKNIIGFHVKIYKPRKWKVANYNEHTCFMKQNLSFLFMSVQQIFQIPFLNSINWNYCLSYFLCCYYCFKFIFFIYDLKISNQVLFHDSSLHTCIIQLL